MALLSVVVSLAQHGSSPPPELDLRMFMSYLGLVLCSLDWCPSRLGHALRPGRPLCPLFHPTQPTAGQCCLHHVLCSPCQVLGARLQVSREAGREQKVSEGRGLRLCTHFLACVLCTGHLVAPEAHGTCISLSVSFLPPPSTKRVDSQLLPF